MGLPDAVSSVLVRQATVADAPLLARLRFEFRAGQGAVTETEAAFRARCEPWMAARLGPTGVWRAWVAEAAGAIVGTAWLQLVEKIPNPTMEPETIGYVSSLYVQPAWRNHGIGAALLTTCLRVCQEADVDAIILWPTPQSRSLYERAGFSATDELFQKRGK
jgi:GNAT superfamily N-acetyltransferase